MLFGSSGTSSLGASVGAVDEAVGAVVGFVSSTDVGMSGFSTGDASLVLQLDLLGLESEAIWM